tara:strand:+ start:199 stop:453 length:255 start_codon:yes stop_codon:yes gene_type:complete
MCFGGRPPSPPPPPPLAPPPPPPVVPGPPTPEAEPLITDVNPQVRRAKSKKAKSQLAKGTGQLRIPLDPQISAPTSGPAGGLNK